MNPIAIMIDSASRPDLLVKTVESLLENIRYDGNIIWYFHEAVLDKVSSHNCIKYIRGLDLKCFVYVEKDPKGEGVSISKILQLVHQSKIPYFIHWEDDMEVLRPIDLNVVERIMGIAKDVNQIAWNRRKTMGNVNRFVKKEVLKADQVLTVCPHWRYTPAIWRMSWIMPRWKVFAGRNSHWNINHLLQGELLKNQNKTADWVMDNMGTYYLGVIGEPAFCTHIGAGRSGREEKK